MRAPGYVATAALLALVLGACGEDDPAEPEPRSAPSSTPTSSAPTTPPSSASSAPTTEAPTGGTADDPVALEVTTELLDWRPVAGPVRDSVTRSGAWTLAVPRNANEYTLEGDGTAESTSLPGYRVGDTLIDGSWAVVVLQDEAEQRPQVAHVTELATGRTFRVDGRSDVPTTTGGTWALGEGKVLHATIGPDRSYCVATVDLASQDSTLGWCAPKRHGFNGARITPAGDSLLTFDDSQPSCRTLVALAGGETTPFEGVEECTGWDGLLTDGGAVWSVIPKEQQIEVAHLYAREGGGYFDLGPGTAGSLVWCGGASYFVRDPQREGDPAALMRWTADDGLTVAYESPAGQAFLGEPRCGGDTITVTALTEQGDEQVTASLS